MTLHDSTGVLILTGVDGRISFWSAAAEASFGWLVSDTSGRHLHEFTATSAARTVLSELPHLDVAQPIKNECRMLHKDGRILQMWLHTIPLRDGTGGLHGYLQVLRELSEGKEAERTALRQANTNVVPVPRTLLHNLNNLVTSIHSTLDLALRRELPGETVDFLNQAQTSARLVVQMVNSFRSIGREPTLATTPARSEAVAASVPARAETSPETQSLEGQERILLAEDDNGIRMLMRAILGYRGYRVTDAADGEAAARQIDQAREPFDLAILDVQMPGLSGPEVLARLRAKWPATRVLFVSGNVDDLRTGADDGVEAAFLGKPFQNVELLQAVRRVLDQPVGKTAAQE